MIDRQVDNLGLRDNPRVNNGPGRGRGGRFGMNADAQRANERVNNMSEQQFLEYMNELHLRDNVKPINANVLA